MKMTQKKIWYLPLVLSSIVGFSAYAAESASQQQNPTRYPRGESAEPPVTAPVTARPPTNPAYSSTTKTAKPVATMTDNQIASVVKAANDAEISAGTLAKTRAESPEVRAFAKDMIDDHNKNNEAEKSVLSKIEGTQSASNEMSQKIRTETATRMKKLENMSGSAFDQAYISQQIAMHKQLLADLNNQFIPAAKDEKLKDYLQSTRQHVSRHLLSAQQVLATMNSGL